MNGADIPGVLRIMEREARIRRAPVFQVEHLKTTPFKTLIFTMLSSRTKDSTSTPRVRRLFVRADNPKAMLRIPIGRLTHLLYGIGFYRTKARRIHAICRLLLDRFNGGVPDTREQLVMLPGVGRKTANVVLNIAFGKPTIGVDTHVHRISNRLGLVRTKTPRQTEIALERRVPSADKGQFNKILVAYGQTVCTPIRPWCSQCPLQGKYCPRVGVKASR